MIRFNNENYYHVYERILKTYYPEFEDEFIISGFISAENISRQVLFNLDPDAEYLVFFVKRNI